MDGLHRQLAMTRMELVIKDSQMYRPLVLLALIIQGQGSGVPHGAGSSGNGAGGAGPNGNGAGGAGPGRG